MRKEKGKAKTRASSAFGLKKRNHTVKRMNLLGLSSSPTDRRTGTRGRRLFLVCTTVLLATALPAAAWMQLISHTYQMAVTLVASGHVTWQNQIDFNGIGLFETITHDDNECGRSECSAGTTDAFQNCVRDTGTTTWTHYSELKVRRDDVQVASKYHGHTHAPGNNGVEQVEACALSATETYAELEAPVFKFQIYVYWPDNTYHSHATKIFGES